MPRPSVSRRTALGALATAATAAGTGLAGCSVGTTVDALKAPTPATPSPSIGPDLTIVDRTVAALQAADRGAPPAFARLHRAQIAALGPGTANPSPEASPSAAPSAPAGTWQQRQKALPATLTAAAVSAHDADLVRLLASAAAAQRQFLQARGLG